MPVAYRIDATQQLASIQGWETLTRQDLVSMAAALRSDPELPSVRRVLADFRQVTAVGGNLDPQSFQSAFPAMVQRVVVANTSSVYGMVRMYALASGADDDIFQVVTTLEEAMERLGVSTLPSTERRIAGQSQ
jgi:hypothetical protein